MRWFKNKCKHVWNVERSLRNTTNPYFDILRTVKTCRKCGEVHINEELI
jgi:hypothetical protein